jgi:hypothetical protein
MAEGPHMKIKQSVFAGITAVLAQSVFGQGYFQNLDFEAAIVSPPPAGYIPSDAQNPISAAEALPGWTVYEDDTICTAVWGTPGLSVTYVSLDYDQPFGYSALQGVYSIGLSAYNLAPGYYTSASISQTGLIPEGTQSIQFLLQNYKLPNGNPAGETLIVTLNGTPIPISVVSTSGYVMTMVGDVGAFAGTTAELKFTAPPEAHYGLDSISFSPQAVPEPGALSLFGLGLLGLGWQLHRKR